jgi:hypothetical protein
MTFTFINVQPILLADTTCSEPSMDTDDGPWAERHSLNDYKEDCMCKGSQG